MRRATGAAPGSQAMWRVRSRRVRPKVPNCCGMKFEAWSQIRTSGLRPLRFVVRTTSDGLCGASRALSIRCSPRRRNVRYEVPIFAPLRMISYVLLSCQTRFPRTGWRCDRREKRLAGVPLRGSINGHEYRGELIADRMDAMPAGERRAAQTLVANYPLIGLKTVADFSAQAGVSSPTILRSLRGSVSKTILSSNPRCKTNSRRNCSHRFPGRPIVRPVAVVSPPRSMQRLRISAKRSAMSRTSSFERSSSSFPTCARRHFSSADVSPIRSPATWRRI